MPHDKLSKDDVRHLHMRLAALLEDDEQLKFPLTPAQFELIKTVSLQKNLLFHAISHYHYRWLLLRNLRYSVLVLIMIELVLISCSSHLITLFSFLCLNSDIDSRPRSEFPQVFSEHLNEIAIAQE